MAKTKTTRPKARTSEEHMVTLRAPARMAHATFAEMLQEQREVLRTLKLPPWLKFLLPYERRDQASLSPEEQQRFLCAESAERERHVWKARRRARGNAHAAHQRPSAPVASDLPVATGAGNSRATSRCQHPVLELDQSQRAIGPRLAGQRPADGRDANAHIKRRSRTRVHVVVGDDRIERTVDHGVHDIWIVCFPDERRPWIGTYLGRGSMSDPDTAATDPIFWMHHANLDHLWWQWYNSAQGNHQYLPLVGTDAVMDPWSYTEPDTRDIAALATHTRSAERFAHIAVA